MNHKGVEFAVMRSITPDVWKWQFRIGDKVVNGQTETRLDLLAVRRARLRIDRELREAQN
jgi:hypothetical protein